MVAGVTLVGCIRLTVVSELDSFHHTTRPHLRFSRLIPREKKGKKNMEAEGDLGNERVEEITRDEQL